MIIAEELEKDKIYVAGRTGELVDFTNPLTYSLIEKIFGFNGPYRKVLARFGISNLRDVRSYLVNLYGRVYSDIQLESEILWEPCGYVLVYDGKSLQTKVKILGKNFLGKARRFIKKGSIEIKIINNLSGYLKEAEQRYSFYDQRTRDVYEREEISVNDFLSWYENVVVISFLHNLVFTYNNQKVSLNEAKGLQAYLETNDYALNQARNLIEFDYYQDEFSLGTQVEVNKIPIIGFIPGTIPDFAGKVSNSIKREAKLQCLRNNLRLKTNLLLYFLDVSLKKRAESYGMAEQIRYLTINEILDLENQNLSSLKDKIEQREEFIKVGKSIYLPDVIVRGEISLEPQLVTVKSYCGVPCSIGTAEGRVQYIEDSTQKIESPIVFLPNATPEFTPQFKQAKGLIFKVGSPLSHGSIIAREMKVPAIVLGINQDLLAGKMVRLEGESGKVELLETLE